MHCRFCKTGSACERPIPPRARTQDSQRHVGLITVVKGTRLVMELALIDRRICGSKEHSDVMLPAI